MVGKSGILLLGEGSAAANPADGNGQMLRSVWRFTLETRKTEDVLHNAMNIVSSADGEKLLYQKGESYFIAAIGDLKPDAADGTPGKSLQVDAMSAPNKPKIAPLAPSVGTE